MAGKFKKLAEVMRREWSNEVHRGRNVDRQCNGEPGSGQSSACIPEVTSRLRASGAEVAA